MKIAIAIPSGDHLVAELAMRLPGIMGTAQAAGHTCVLLNQRASNPAANLGLMLAAVLEHGFDAVLTLDSDMAPPADVLPRLLAREVDVVGVLYRGRQPPYGIHGRDLDGQVPAPPYTGLREVGWVAGGCVLIRRHVLEAMGQPLREDVRDETGRLIGHDVWFCLRARELGFGVFADLDVSAETAHYALVPLRLECKGRLA
jgi:GT2 family glycosyltransferase